MKKIVSIICLGVLVGFSSSVSAQQNIVKFLPFGGMIQSQHAGGASFVGRYYQLGVGFERVFGAKTSGQLDLGGLFGGVLTGGSAGYLKPAFKYYLLDDAPHGLSIGAYLPLAFSSNAIIVGLGPQAGYQMFFLDNKLAASADIGLGFGYVAGTGTGAGGAAGVNFDISIGAGYAF